MNFDTYRCSRPLKLKTRIPNNETDTLANEEVINQSIFIHHQIPVSIHLISIQVKKTYGFFSELIQTSICCGFKTSPLFALCPTVLCPHPIPNWVQKDTVAQGGSAVTFCLDESVKARAIFCLKHR